MNHVSRSNPGATTLGLFALLIGAAALASPAPDPRPPSVPAPLGSVASLHPDWRPRPARAVGPLSLSADLTVGGALQAPSPHPPLVLALNHAQMQAILVRHQGPAVALMPGAAFDDVTVVALAAEEPMRDPAREVWGGLAAPIWAILHPTQSWRIFLPIPPK